MRAILAIPFLLAGILFYQTAEMLHWAALKIMGVEWTG